MREQVNSIQWGKNLVRTIEIHRALDSTNEFGKRRIKSGGIASGTVLWALEQTKGKGRQGRVWESDQGSLTFSFVWRYPGESLPSALTLAVGLGLVMELGPLVPGLKLKWPNDLWVGTRKLGGILTETLHRAGDLWLVVGVGLNVNSVPQGEGRTSLREVTGCTWTRLGILHQAACGLERGFALAWRGSNLPRLCREHGNFLDRPLLVQQGRRWFRARARDVLPDGRLLLEAAWGRWAALPDEIRLVLD